MSHEKLTSPQLWDYAAYTAIPADGQRHEILAGVRFVNPAPNLYHQQLSRRIQFQMYTQIELTGLGVVIDAPADVRLSARDIVQPDLIVVTSANLNVLTPSCVLGIPDLLIEIQSPHNPEYDSINKRKIYERCGVPEYWIICPQQKCAIQLVMSEGQYQESFATERITMTIAPHAVVDLTKIW
jgi:Uma2 family endonuclease